MRRSIYITALLIGLAVLFGRTTPLRADDFQGKYRLSLSAWQQGDWEVQLHAETRWQDDSSRLKERLFTPQILWQATEHLKLAAAYTHLEFRSGKGFDNDHRLELEANPHWKLADWASLDLRNRMEFRFRDGPGNGTERYRGRAQFVFPINHLGPLTSVYANDEVFYDFGFHQVNQNRLTPIGLGFKLNDHAQFRIFYMIQSTRSKAEWDHAEVLGTHLLFKLK